jgi:drug/metabolite transporter (DMT)-like permease
VTPAAPRTSLDLRGAGLIVLAAACFGTLGPLSRFAEEAGVGSLALVTWRAAIGAIVVGAFVGVRLASGGARPASFGTIPVRDRWFVVAAAVANTVLNFSVFVAFTRIEIALALLVFYLYPALVAIVSAIWFGERLDPLRWGALAIAFLGLGLVLAGTEGGVGAIDPIGIGLALVGGLAQVFYVLAARHGFSHVPAPQAAALTMSGAAVLYLLVAVVIGQLGVLVAPLASTDALLPVAIAGVIGAGIPTLAYITGIRRLGAPRAAILAMLEPLVGVLLAAWLLAEQPTLVQLAGGGLILVAAVLLQLPQRGPAVDHEAVAAP